MNERNTFIVRVGEVALKGQNKPYFEKTLVDRIRRLLKKYQGVEVTRHEGLIFVYADKDIPEDTIISEIDKLLSDEKGYNKMVECSKKLGITDSATRIYEEARKIIR